MHDEVLPVYLVHWRQPEWCLSAVRSILSSKDAKVEVIVVNNGDDSIPLRAFLPDSVRILETEHNAGFSGGANIALADASAVARDHSWYVLGSHDLHVEPDTLSRLVAAAKANPGFGILAPQLTSPLASSGGVWKRSGGYQLPLSEAAGLLERDWVSGTCMLLTRQCMEEVGPFNEAFGSYAEDVDICLRARDAGWKVGVLAEAFARGIGSGSVDASTLIHANGAALVLQRSGFLQFVIAVARIAVHAMGDLKNYLDRSKTSVEREEARVRLRAALRSLVMIPRQAVRVVSSRPSGTRAT